MSNVETVKQQVAEMKPMQGLKELVEKSAKEIGRALPQHMRPERVVRIAITCINNNPQLANCTPSSFMGSLFAMAQLGLEPVGGRCYLLPFNNKRKVGNEWKTVKEVQLVVGYKGYVDLFYRHEAAISIDGHTVYEKDSFDYEYGINPMLKHRPAEGDRGKEKGYYVVAKLRGGGNVFRYMTREECMEHGRKHSKTWDNEKQQFHPSSPWNKESGPMCLKTVLLQTSKFLPLSIEIQQAIAADESSRDYREGVQNTLDLPITTSWEEAETKSAEKTQWELESEAEEKSMKEAKG